MRAQPQSLFSLFPSFSRLLYLSSSFFERRKSKVLHDSRCFTPQNVGLIVESLVVALSRRKKKTRDRLSLPSVEVFVVSGWFRSTASSTMILTFRKMLEIMTDWLLIALLTPGASSATSFYFFIFDCFPFIFSSSSSRLATRSRIWPRHLFRERSWRKMVVEMKRREPWRASVIRWDWPAFIFSSVPPSSSSSSFSSPSSPSSPFIQKYILTVRY